MLGFPNTSLLELIITRTNVISLDAAVKFIKLAFTYEEWSLFESAAMHLIYFLQVIYAKPFICFCFVKMTLDWCLTCGMYFSKRQDDAESKKAENDLTLLIAIEPLINIKKNRGLIFPLDSYKEGESAQIYLKQIALHGEYLFTFLENLVLLDKICPF